MRTRKDFDEILARHAEKAGLDNAIIFNTCAVTAEATRQARQAIRRARRERPGAEVIVTGCAAETSADRFAAMAEVDEILPNAEKRNPALPDVPAISEKIPGFGGDLWIALFGVAGTSPEVIDTLYQATARVMQKPSVQKKLSDQGVELAFDTPAQLATRLQKDIVKWREIVNASGARVD